MIMEQKLISVCAALAVFALAMAIPQGSVLAKKGMTVRTTDLCPTVNADISDDPDVDESNALGTAAVVTDNRFTDGTGTFAAWAVSLDSLKKNMLYGVFNAGTGPGQCVAAGFVYPITTDVFGNAFKNEGSEVAVEVDDVVQICRGGIAILEGDLVKGGKERNKPNRC